MFVNHYEILGVVRDASLSEIRSAYRKLALKFHPDKNEGDAFLMEMFKKINSANEILSDDIKRAKYDLEYDNFFKSSKRNSSSSNESWYSEQSNSDNSLARIEIERAHKEYTFAREKVSSERANYDKLKSNKVTAYGDTIKVLWFFTIISFLFVISNINVTGGSKEFVQEPTKTHEFKAKRQAIKKSRSKPFTYSEKIVADSLATPKAKVIKSMDSSSDISFPNPEKLIEKKVAKGKLASVHYSSNPISGSKEDYNSFLGKNPQKGTLFSKSFFNKKEIKSRVSRLLGGSNYKFFEDNTKTFGKSHDIKIIDNILLADSFIEHDNLHKIVILIDVASNKLYISMIQNNQSELEIFSETDPIPDRVLNIIVNYFNNNNGALYSYTVEGGNIRIAPR